LFESELERERGHTLFARRGHDFQSIDLHELALEWCRDVVGDRVGARAGIVDCREIVYGELKVSHHPEKDHGKRQDRGHYWPPDEWFRKIHFDPPASTVAGLAGACWI